MNNFLITTEEHLEGKLKYLNDIHKYQAWNAFVHVRNISPIWKDLNKELKKVDDSLKDPNTYILQLEECDKEISTSIEDRETQKELIKEQNKLIKETKQKINNVNYYKTTMDDL